MAYMNINNDDTDGVFQVVEDSKKHSIYFGITSVLEVMEYLMQKGEESFNLFWDNVGEVIEYASSVTASSPR